MRPFVGNIVLALLWAAVAGEVNAVTIGSGFVIGYVVLVLVRPLTGSSAYLGRIRHIVVFAGFFLRELIESNLRVAYDVLTPTLHARPGIIGVPLDARTDTEITAVANVVSMTPGQLSLDVSADRRTLFIHAMYVAPDADAVRVRLKRDLERRVLALLR